MTKYIYFIFDMYFFSFVGAFENVLRIPLTFFSVVMLSCTFSVDKISFTAWGGENLKPKITNKVGKSPRVTLLPILHTWPCPDEGYFWIQSYSIIHLDILVVLNKPLYLHSNLKTKNLRAIFDCISSLYKCS